MIDSKCGSGARRSVARLVDDISRAIRGWWSSDRIRISPAEGRMFRIAIGDILTVDDTHFEVLSRTSLSAGGGPAMELTCRSESGCGTCRVTITLCEGTERITWNDGDLDREILSRDVDCWSMQD
jgi:hypothetical protein